jgi:hypothetical protein
MKNAIDCNVVYAEEDQVYNSFAFAALKSGQTLPSDVYLHYLNSSAFASGRLLVQAVV